MKDGLVPQCSSAELRNTVIDNAQRCRLSDSALAEIEDSLRADPQYADTLIVMTVDGGTGDDERDLMAWSQLDALIDEAYGRQVALQEANR